MKRKEYGEAKRDRRKASYTDRPLTEEERAFASAPENYNQFLRYMKVRKLDEEEWYDTLIFYYLRLVKKYFEVPEMRKVNFTAALFTTLDHRRLDCYRDMNRMKRIPINQTVSLDWETENPDDKGKKTAPMTWIDLKQSVERTVLYHEMISEILANLNGIQTDIFMRLLKEYAKEEIREEINMNSWQFRKQLKEIKQAVIDYLSI